jgi:tetratricopeptide (TPR) repeat protein
MMKRLFIIMLAASLPALLFGQSERQKLFAKANQAYEAGQMQQALDQYLDLVFSGEISFELYYNLGNTYYRTGKIGKAIQYWEKAALLNPANDDVNHNLELARLKILDRVILPKAFFLFEYYWQLRNSAPLYQWLTWSAWLVFFTLLAWLFPYWLILPKNIRGRLKRVGKIPVLLLTIAFLFFAAISLDALRYEKNNHNAIIISREVQVKSAPLNSSNTLFILHEGSKVKLITDDANEWYEISYFDDKSGWVRKDDLGEI